MPRKLTSDAVVEALTRAGVPLEFSALAERLGLRAKPQQRRLSRLLQSLQEHGQVVCNRRNAYGIAREMNLSPGTVISHRDGFGFLSLDEGGPDWFLPPDQMRQVLPGDRVLARVAGHDRRGKPEARIAEVIERNTHELIGRYLDEHGVGLVVPQTPSNPHRVLIPPDWRGAAEAGQIVRVRIREQPSRQAGAVGEVIEVLGDVLSPDLHIDVAILDFKLPEGFPEQVLGEAAAFPAPAPEPGRRDARDIEFVTIDGADARDFDDAVCARREGRGWRLWVAIADVAAYVRPGTALDLSARERGNSVYFPGRVLPMLPPRLSDDLCSLRPEVDRFALICEMRFSGDGELQEESFYPGLIRSRARLIYEDVAAALASGEHQHIELLRPLHALYKTLQQARERRGALDFGSREVRFVQDDQGHITGIEPVERNDAHRLIEECMISANVATARFLRRHELPFLARIHEPPPPLHLADLREFLAEWQLSLGGGEQPRPADFAKVLCDASGRPEQPLVQMVMLRSLSQARYAPSDAGHFGLALEDYAHFTSPIRRYPDLVVHRTIHHQLAGAGALPWSHAELELSGDHCSFTDRRAEQASGSVLDALKCDYLAGRVGDEFEGQVTGVTAFGLFVEIGEIRASGLVHISALGNDYYHHESKHHRLRGARSGQLFRLGDTMRVRLVRVDPGERKIDFEPLAHRPALAVGRSQGQPTWREL